MCGIAGIVSKKVDIREEKLRGLASSLAHRGPDDEGIEMIPIDGDRSVGFVHRRLSIIDLSDNGHQPMCDSGTGNWIVFNGEIYNYRTLRKELQGKGYRFHSESDTEVILKAYAEYGPACLEKLRGMFAFGLWDAGVKKLFLAVDRFGIKPLYYWQDNQRFLFASEVKALLGTGIIPKEIDSLAADSFLAFGAVQAPYTIIQGVHALLPAHALVYDPVSGTHEVFCYWAPPREKQEVDNFDAKLEDAVRHHLVSDVPVGLFLSGGVDSSALAILVNRVCGGGELESFSIGFPEHEFSESHIARLVGERFCKRHHELEISDSDLQALLPKALAAQDQPTIDGVNTYVISKAVRAKGIKVVLSGQGGDEVFGGYPTFPRIPKMMCALEILRRTPCIARMLLSQIIGDRSVLRSKLSQYIASADDIISIYAILRQLFSKTQRQNIMGEEVSEWGVPDEVSKWLKEECGGREFFDQISILELRGYLANTLLRDGDVMSMAHGLEIRVPYLDHILLESVFSLSESAKAQRGIPKTLLLRTVMADMPKEVYWRKKMGFTFPWDVWLRNRFQKDIKETFAELKENPLGLAPSACQEVWKRFLDRDPRVSWSRVWGLYVLVQWIRRNI